MYKVYYIISSSYGVYILYDMLLHTFLTLLYYYISTLLWIK